MLPTRIIATAISHGSPGASPYCAASARRVSPEGSRGGWRATSRKGLSGTRRRASSSSGRTHTASAGLRQNTASAAAMASRAAA